MKKLAMFLLVMLIAATGINAHEGSLGLFTSSSADDCDMAVPPFSPTNIWLMYIRSDSGPDGITGAEFKAELSTAQVQWLTPTWAAGTMIIGDPATGIGIVFNDGCTGQGSPTVYIGTLQIMSVGAPAGWTMHIVPSPEAQDPSSIWVSRCDANKTIHPVLGGWFHDGEGNCNVEAESKTWGAIKNMYNN
ncbi:MAG: hypothetical protein JW814_07210 [Candidatus Krumholzibacteriota bacterium]|nr:hypothetical protein [Candidatus Krumholzibacteriota bacterium]